MKMTTRLQLYARDTGLYGVMMFVLIPTASLLVGNEPTPWGYVAMGLGVIAVVAFAVTRWRRRRASAAEQEVWRTKHNPTWMPGDKW